LWGSRERGNYVIVPGEISTVRRRDARFMLGPQRSLSDGLTRIVYIKGAVGIFIECYLGSLWNWIGWLLEKLVWAAVGEMSRCGLD